MHEKFDLYKSFDKIIISQSKQSIYSINRSNFHEITENNADAEFITSFFFILGLYKYECSEKSNHYFLVIVTEIDEIDFFNIYRIKSFEIVQLTQNTKTKETNKFEQLLRIGLNHCSMYFSDHYNLTLTFEQQFQNHPSRTNFIWNYEAIKCLSTIWPKAKCYKEVIAGFIEKVHPFVMIIRKSNKNGGCHSWNRGSDINGNAANYLENEEIMILKQDKSQDIKKCQIDAVSHFEISPSCPILWSKYPTMFLSRSFEFGPEGENERRFNLHFDHLENCYIEQQEECSFHIISLLNNHGKEHKLNEIYKKLAKKRGIQFKHIKFNHILKKGENLSQKISKLKNHFDACLVKNGRIIQKQTKIIRVNCSSCLDRTNIFMEILFQFIFEKYDKNLFLENIENHKKIWYERANVTAKDYALTCGMRTYLIESDYKTFKSKCFNYAVLWKRFFCSILYEGLYCDAYNTVLQERPFIKFDDSGFFWKMILFVKLIFIFIYVLFFEGKMSANKLWKKRIKTIIDHPHIYELFDSYDFFNNNFPKTKS